MMVSNMYLLRLLQFCCVCLAIASCDYVPVVMLTSPSGTLPSRSVSAVHKISEKEFCDDYVNKLKGQGPLILFLQDTLSLEDFGKYGNIYGSAQEESAFKNLEESIDKYPSLYISAVQTSGNGLVWPCINDWNVHELESSSVDFNTTDISENTLLLVKFPGTVTADNRKAAIQKNDKAMGKILDRLHEVEKFSVIFTGEQPSWTADQDHVRISRHILEDMDTNITVPGIFFFNNFTIFHADNITYSVEGNATDQFSDVLTINKGDAFRINDTIWFSMSGEGSNINSINVSFEFMKLSGTWYLASLKTDVTTKNQQTQVADMQFDDVWAPLGMSFNCKNLGKLYDKNRTVDFSLNIDNMQVQPIYNYTGNKFGDAFDCVGFFTIPIWMSIFITIVLVLILAYGVSMLMDINTNDRFDDPKGKTITVPTVD